MIKLTPNGLANSVSLITTFMRDDTKHLKTFEELQNIFDNSYKNFDPDPANDLRILNYERDMESKNWNEPIILMRDVRLNIIVDGIHRGIAYLRCVSKGINRAELPDVYVINNFVGFSS